MADTPPQAPPEGAAPDTAGDGTGFGTRTGRTGTSADVLPDVDGRDGGDGPLWRRVAEERWGEGRAATAVGAVVAVLAVALTAFQLYVALFAGLDARQQRIIHLLFVMVLVFLLMRPFDLGKASGLSALTVVRALIPRRRKGTVKGEDVGDARDAAARRVLTGVGWVLDLVLVTAAVVVSVYPIRYQDELAARAGAYTGLDWVLGLILMIVLLEATRRAVGMIMVLLVVAFVYYAWIGPFIPGQFGHTGATIQRISTHTYLGDGIYGLTLGVVVTFVFVFILFGALLNKTGGGNFFVGLAYVVTGRMVGGPAKGAVLGSAMMGSVSGSAIANVVTSGPFTIPLMRKVGYRRADAAGVEAAASTGGQILPPIMGAGAFIMAERTGIPYADIVKVALIPALMYFGVMFLFVDILARKHGIGVARNEDLPRLRLVMAAGWHFLLPLLLLIVLLLQYVPPTQAGLYACGALLAVAMLRAGSRLSPSDLLDVFVMAARNTLPVSAACAVAGIIVGMVGLTGLGLTLSNVLVTVFAGNLLLTLVMVAVASLIMGFGLPVTASYVVISVLAVPALGELGLTVLVAHMIVYWYSQDSNVTPPVALAAFAAAGIAGAKPMRAGAAAWKFAKGLYLIPVMMAYSALLAVDGPVLELAAAVLSGCVALAAAAIAIEGHFLRRTTLGERLGLILAAALVMVGPEWAALAERVLSTAVAPHWFVLAGSALGVALIALQAIGHRRSRGAEDTVTVTDQLS
ncbi:TRAP transporter fused permease subunit [Nocardiopsis sp. EMB25]|uniref:TRAP transporter permease n=1 Tax=Nocardiopsis sp. EMB25 TaxID=2835867 RepID=UPI002284E8AE|nr:TRAP transporter fused permease subunit [Nocardiopsis sp. EMB25]MCY9785861.1 TRAP transporter fused permease subunit [Nocardiopsis sp. EMB25]